MPRRHTIAVLVGVALLLLLGGMTSAGLWVYWETQWLRPVSTRHPVIVVRLEGLALDSDGFEVMKRYFQRSLWNTHAHIEDYPREDGVRTWPRKYAWVTNYLPDMPPDRVKLVLSEMQKLIAADFKKTRPQVRWRLAIIDPSGTFLAGAN